MNPLQKQEGGSHYKNCAIQPVEYIHANGLGYIEGAVIKYVTRYKAKNGAEDIKKAIHFLELLLQLEYPANAAAIGGLCAHYDRADGTCNLSILEASCNGCSGFVPAAAHKAPSLCDSEVDEWADKDLCGRCGNSASFDCPNKGKAEGTIILECGDFSPEDNQ